jgi:virulence-associated protein VapD
LARESRRRYAINFDLTIAQLRKHYDKDHPKSAYGKIKRYMLKHGFSHRQWSGYISVQNGSGRLYDSSSQGVPLTYQM